VGESTGRELIAVFDVPVSMRKEVRRVVRGFSETTRIPNATWKKFRLSPSHRKNFLDKKKRGKVIPVGDWKRSIKR